MQAPFLGTIPLDPAIVENSDEGVPTVISAPESASAEAFRKIARLVVEQIGGDAPGAGEQPEWLGKLRGELGR